MARLGLSEPQAQGNAFMNRTEFEKKIRAIAWEKLQHAYGDAGDVPDVLMTLFSASSRERGRALTHLRHSVLHQGFPENSSPVVVPFLIDLIQLSEVQNRAAILSFLSEFSHGYRQTKLGHNEWLEAYDWKPGKVVDGLYLECYELVCRGISIYLDLFEQGDEEIAEAAMNLLCWLPKASAAFLPRLREKRNTRVSSSFRQRLSLALGASLFVSGQTPTHDDLLYLRQEQNHQELSRRVCAILAQCYSGEVLTSEGLLILRDGLCKLPYDKKDFGQTQLYRKVSYALQWIHKQQPLPLFAVYQSCAEFYAEHFWPRRSKEAHSPGLGIGDIMLNLVRIVFTNKDEHKKWPRDFTHEEQWTLRFIARTQIPNGDRSSIENALGSLSMLLPGREKMLWNGKIESLSYFLSEPSPYEVLHKKVSIKIGRKTETNTVREIWKRVANTKDKAGFLKALSISEFCTFVEEHFAQYRTEEESQKEERLLFDLVQSMEQNCFVKQAVERKIDLLLSKGALQSPRISHTVFRFFARWSSWAWPEQSPKAMALLRDSGEFLGHQITLSLRPMLLALPIEDRGKFVDSIRIGSFVEPDFAWALYDVAPSARRLKRLLRALAPHQDFFSGPGAFALVHVIASQPQPLLQLVAEKLQSAPQKNYAHVLAAGLAMNPNGLPLLQALQFSENKLIEQILRRKKMIDAKFLRSIGIDASNKNNARPKGGVIGANGKPWNGSMPRFRKRQQSSL